MKYKRPTTAIISDAGYATRFLPWSKVNPKAMVPVGNKTAMQLVVEECVAADLERVIIVATEEGKSAYEELFFGKDNQNIRNLLKKQGKLERYQPVEELLALKDKIDITVIVQGSNLPYGNASPLLAAEEYLADDEMFVCCFSDDLVIGGSDVAKMASIYDQRPDYDGIIMTQKIPRHQTDKYGIVVLRPETSMLDHIVEKPACHLAPSLQAAYGRYLLPPSLLGLLKQQERGKDDELWLVDAITTLAHEGNVYVATTDNQWKTTGDPLSYAEAIKAYLEWQGADDVQCHERYSTDGHFM